MKKSDELIKLAAEALEKPDGGSMSHQTALAVLNMLCDDRDFCTSIDQASSEDTN